LPLTLVLCEVGEIEKQMFNNNKKMNKEQMNIAELPAPILASTLLPAGAVGLRVLSLFDGMSCGQQALERTGVTVSEYYASEIDKHAIAVTMSNYPNTKGYRGNRPGGEIKGNRAKPKRE